MADQTPLTNADFRKLLQTPRRDAATPSGQPGATPRREGQKSKKPNYKPKPTNAEGEDGEPKYRDRAEERRRGINPDYAATSSLLNVLGSEGQVDTSKLSVEDSKYLGGDLEHTHLVKGLDYALLNKMRSEMHKKEGGEEGDEEGGAQAGEEGRPVRQAPVKLENLTINHAAARGVYAALFGSRKSNVHEQFLPKRTAFVYSFEPDEDGFVSDIPTTLRRSKADCPTPIEAVFARMDGSILERILKIMSYIKTGKDGRKLKKKEKDEPISDQHTGVVRGGTGAVASASGRQGPGIAPAAAADDDADIFADAGTDYKPSVTGKKKQPPSHAPAAGGAAADMDLDNSALPPPPPPPAAAPHDAAGDPYYIQQQRWQQQQQAEQQGYAYDGQGWGGGSGGGSGGQREEDVPKWRVRRSNAAEKQVDFVDDAYGEYYPMAINDRKVWESKGGGDLPDDDDDVPSGKDERPGETEGRGRGRPGDKQGGRGPGDAKLNSQLQKIQGIFKDKGYAMEGFNREQKEEGRMPMGGMTPRLQTGEQTPSMKKRRI